MSDVSARMEANEAMRCSRSGCTSLRYGLGGECREHVTDTIARRRAAAAKAVATRRRNHPHRFRPATPDLDYWRASAAAVVGRAKRAGILPDLSTGEYACADCGDVASEYDHRDYGRPLHVQPVCRRCNNRRGVAKYPHAGDFNFKKLGT